MMLDRIAALAASGESETLEFKETTGTRREAAMTVCAFMKRRKRAVLEELFKALLHKLMTGEIRVGS